MTHSSRRRNQLAVARVSAAVKDLLLDLVLPRTDRAVFVQWAVMIPFWVIVVITTRRLSKDVRTFIVGLAFVNLAWFAFRMVH